MNWQARPQALASAIRETPQSVQRPGRAAPDRRGASRPAGAVMRPGVPPGPRHRPQGRCLPAGTSREDSGKKGQTGPPPMAAQQSRRSPWYSPENRRPGSGFLRGIACRRKGWCPVPGRTAFPYSIPLASRCGSGHALRPGTGRKRGGAGRSDLQRWPGVTAPCPGDAGAGQCRPGVQRSFGHRHPWGTTGSVRCPLASAA